MKRPSKNPWKVVLVLATITVSVVAGVSLFRALDDRELMDATTQYIGRDHQELVEKIGPPSTRLETPEDYERFSVEPSPPNTIYVYSGERGVACVVVDETGVVRQVLHRGSPP